MLRASRSIVSFVIDIAVSVRPCQVMDETELLIGLYGTHTDLSSGSLDLHNDIATDRFVYFLPDRLSRAISIYIDISICILYTLTLTHTLSCLLCVRVWDVETK